MKRAHPQDLDRKRVEQLLSEAKSSVSAGARVELFSRYFIGFPYRQNPLIGSHEAAEVFTAAMDGFDCVTYVETVLALSRASTAAEFTEWLRKIRYHDGLIQWTERNHYLTSWIRNNIRIGAIRRIPTRVPRSTRDKTLNVLKGLAPVKTKFECVPKRMAGRLASDLQTGDLIFFASTRKNLDVFHCGVIVRDDHRLRMRHASRSQGRVVEQDLNEFLKNNRMAGLIVARPAAQERGK